MTADFFARDTRLVARELLGMEIIRRRGNKIIRGYITETEAYRGLDDKASHASRGKTRRTLPMFAHPGTIYIYLIYGMYYCFNLVTEREDYPAAVLIRGVYIPSSKKLLDGPGKVTRELGITKFLNKKDIFKNKYLEIGKRVITPKNIVQKPRVGVEYAGTWAKKPWRFMIH